MAKLGRQTGVVGEDTLARSSAGSERLSAVVPTLEAVNRNARRPKKVCTLRDVQQVQQTAMTAVCVGFAA